MHGGDLYAESINIPMILTDTDLSASRSLPYATQLDLAPTIADLVGIPVPAQWEGTSLLGTLPDISTTQTASARPIEAVIWRQAGESYKYLFDVRHNTEELFELRTDPREQRNLIAKAGPALLAFLRGTRARRFKESPARKP
jgi:arylsulfatase A-like enzyme